MCASFGSTRLMCASSGSTRLICASFGSTRLICASFGSTRLMCASSGSTRLICASFGSTRLICASYGTTRLLCRVRAQRGADRREAGRTREGHMDACSFEFTEYQLLLGVSLGSPKTRCVPTGTLDCVHLGTRQFWDRGRGRGRKNLANDKK
ncbi:NAC-alpha domain-containing protein 1 [Cucumis melo var. makuwa]|uniref:NAC-alpha domain-containing protein 1 n=1 Tax=Cucumis melo var. makuwa TaxID=1194695 RepID=A0A5A7U0S7_CUCMM|nr:NAC-alpha domain-containing protein 1 [Cucumis melo var. makuwa]